MHRAHLRLCGLGLVLALGYLLLTGSSAGGIGLLIAALVCPLAMILAMSVLMGHDSHEPAGERTENEVDPVLPVAPGRGSGRDPRLDGLSDRISG